MQYLLRQYGPRISGDTPMVKIDECLSLPVTIINRQPFVTVGSGRFRKRRRLPSDVSRWEEWVARIKAERDALDQQRLMVDGMPVVTFLRPLAHLGVMDLEMVVQQKKEGQWHPYFVIEPPKPAKGFKFGMIRFGMERAWRDAVICVHQHFRRLDGVERILEQCPSREDLAMITRNRGVIVPASIDEPLGMWPWRKVAT